jgi:hypothetical protein
MSCEIFSWLSVSNNPSLDCCQSISFLDTWTSHMDIISELIRISKESIFVFCVCLSLIEAGYAFLTVVNESFDL